MKAEVRVDKIMKNIWQTMHKYYFININYIINFVKSGSIVHKY